MRRITAFLRRPLFLAAGLIIVFVVVIIISAVTSAHSVAQPFCVTHILNRPNGVLRIAIAATPAQISTGLMFREDLSPDEGMLFVLGRDEEATFWMKNTPTPLDIVFLAADLRVIRTTRGEPFSTEPLPSGDPAPFVLEVRSGVADRLGLKTGQKIGEIVALDAPQPCRD